MSILFQKVSEEQFKKDCVKLHWGPDNIDDAEILIPRRATLDSAGYDFYSPINFIFHPGKSITIPTGIKASLPTRTFLMIVPRSSIGFKYQMRMANTVGIIDADYYNNPDNEGHIMIRLTNCGKKDFILQQGKAFCQGIILDYAITDDDFPKNYDRKGGIGSTDSQKEEK